MSARRLIAALVLVLPTAYAGCVQLPVSGPVQRSDAQGPTSGRLPSDIDPQPPRRGDSRLDVVNGFLEAMTAWPVKTTVAKEYLTHDAAREWNPEASTVVYANFAPPTDDPGGVTVHLSGAARLDSSGAWRGALPAAQQTLHFSVVRQGADYRIADPPDAMVVPATWFQQRFGQVSLFYFDARAKYLVPEPVFVPLGDQLPTALVSSLLAGPPRGLSGVVRSFLPHGLSVGLSVPVSAEGVADVQLVGDRPVPSADEEDLLVAQLAATLRQDAGITGFTVSINDKPLRPGGGGQSYPVTTGEEYAAAPATAARLYGLQRRRLLVGDPDGLLPVPGPFGTGRLGADSFAVTPDGDRAVAITGTGSQAVEAALSGAGATPRTLLSGGNDLARPTADLSGRVWLLDRRAHGARVWCVDKGRATQVVMPGVTGQDARRLLVSRDGTRLLAVVHRGSGDAVLGARVATAPDGRVQRLVAAMTVPSGQPGRRIDDIAWAGPTRIAILSPTRPGSLYEVDILSADGSTVGADTLSTVIGGHVLGLAGPGDTDLPTYAVMKDALVDVRTRISTPLADRVGQVSYPG